MTQGNGIYDLKFNQNSIEGKMGKTSFSDIVGSLGGGNKDEATKGKGAAAAALGAGVAGQAFGVLQKDPQAYDDVKGYTPLDKMFGFMGSDPNAYDESTKFSDANPYEAFQTNQIDPYKHDTKSVVSTIGQQTASGVGAGAMFGLPGAAIGGVIGLGSGIGTSIINKKKSKELDQIQADAENQYYADRSVYTQNKSAEEQQRAQDKELYGRVNTFSTDNGSIYNIG